MKISAYYKARGAFVTMSKRNSSAFPKRLPDKIYISIIFKKNKHMFDSLKSLYPYSQIDIGGSGYDLKIELPPEIEAMKPDYTLYPENDYNIGFSSRGCLRTTKTCPWCIVPAKEGKFKRAQHPKLWYNPEFGKITFLDNNILADKRWFMEISAWCIEKGLRVWFTQGLDIRLVDDEIARRLVEMPRHQMTTFAWDRIEDEAIVKSKIELLKQWSNAKMHFWRCDIDEYVQSTRISA